MSDWLRDRGEGRAFLVHRLDRDTSGVLLFAKSEAVQQRFQNEWNTLIRRRGYRAVVEGAPPEPAGTIRTQLRENRIHRVYSGPAPAARPPSRITRWSAWERTTPCWP